MTTHSALLVAATIALALPSGGCCSLAARFPGTCGSYSDDIPVYPGVALYADLATHAFGESYDSDRAIKRAGTCVLWLDLPASVALDTVLLPFDLAIWAGRRREE